MSLSIWIMKKMIERTGTAINHDTWDVEKMREQTKAMAKMPVKKGVSFEEKVYDGVEVDVATPEKMRTENIVLYIHGGGMVSNDPRYCRSFTSYFAKEYGGRVYGIAYGLAPEHKYPEPIEDCVAAYNAIAAENPDSKITLLGESGGGYLCLATTVMLKKKGCRMPDALVVNAPLTDWSDELDRSIYVNDWSVDYRSLDDMRDAFCPEGQDYKDPDLSPRYADLSGFPPIRIAWDADECMRADGLAFLEAARSAGVQIEYKEWKNTMHAIGLTTPSMVKEAKTEIKDIVKFIDRVTQ